MNLLVIEDDVDMLHFLQQAFREEGFSVDTASDGEIGFAKARSGAYDIILLDNHLPKKMGKEICAEIRRLGGTARIIMLSVAGEIETKVDLLNCGADDYVTKPFIFSELLARVRALLRRPEPLKQTILEVGVLRLDPIAHTVHREGKEISLTPKEFGFLYYLMRNEGRTVSRMSILEHVWGGDADPFTNTIETHVLNLRKKLGEKKQQPLIHTISGVGYKIMQ